MKKVIVLIASLLVISQASAQNFVSEPASRLSCPFLFKPVQGYLATSVQRARYQFQRVVSGQSLDSIDPNQEMFGSFCARTTFVALENGQINNRSATVRQAIVTKITKEDGSLVTFEDSLRKGTLKNYATLYFVEYK